MATIEIPDSLAEQLIATGKELASQDNLHTNWPVWYVTEIKKVQRPDGEGEFRERIDVDAIDDKDLCDDCRNLWENEGDIPNECDSYACRDTMYWFDKEREFASYGSEFFLTQKACQEYIDANAYHFSNPKPYAGSAHRNHEIQPIIQALILMAGEEVSTNHYGGHQWLKQQQ